MTFESFDLHKWVQKTEFMNQIVDCTQPVAVFSFTFSCFTWLEIDSEKADRIPSSQVFDFFDFELPQSISNSFEANFTREKEVQSGVDWFGVVGGSWKIHFPFFIDS